MLHAADSAANSHSFWWKKLRSAQLQCDCSLKCESLELIIFFFKIATHYVMCVIARVLICDIKLGMAPVISIRQFGISKFTLWNH